MATVGEAPGPRLPVDRVVRGDPGIVVARMTLGLTLYLRDMEAWARGPLAEAFQRFAAVTPPGALAWLSTSARDLRHPLAEKDLPELQEGLISRKGPRQLWWVRVADEVDVPRCGFTYREIHPALTPRLGYLQICLPPDTAPAVLLQLAQEIVGLGPVHVGLGGYAASAHPFRLATAFKVLYGWCRRYLGLDVQRPDRMAWLAGEHLPGVSWLTILGDAFADQARVAEADLQGWKSPITVERWGHARVLRAGPAPALGDLHEGALPDAYFEVAARLARLFPEKPPTFPLAFGDDPSAGARWFRRLLAPRDWA